MNTLNYASNPVVSVDIFSFLSRLLLAAFAAKNVPPLQAQSVPPRRGLLLIPHLQDADAEFKSQRSFVAIAGQPASQPDSA